MLDQELENIRSVLINNGYPESIINLKISRKVLRFKQSPKEGPQNCPVYLKLPWIGDSSLKFERKITTSIRNCFGAVQPRVVHTTKKLWPVTHKDFLPTLHLSNVVYQYVCRCDSRFSTFFIPCTLQPLFKDKIPPLEL